MERLLQPSSSSTISPSKFPSRTSPFLPRLRSSSLGFVSSHRPDSRRLSSISCNHFQNPSAFTPIRSNKTNNSFNAFPEAEESKPNPGFLQRIVKAASEQRKSTAGICFTGGIAGLDFFEDTMSFVEIFLRCTEFTGSDCATSDDDYCNYETENRYLQPSLSTPTSEASERWRQRRRRKNRRTVA